MPPAAHFTICLMLGLTWGGEQTSAWTSLQVLSMLAASIVLLVLFLFAERKAHEPILPLDLFRISGLASRSPSRCWS